MKPRISVLTIGVTDLERAVAFYRDGLGLPTPGIVGKEFEHGAVAFFDLQAGLKLALWPRADLSWDTGLPASAPCPTGFSIGHNVASKAEVDQVMAQVRGRRPHRQACAGHLLWRLRGLLPGPRRQSLGSRVESADPAGRRGLSAGVTQGAGWQKQMRLPNGSFTFSSRPQSASSTPGLAYVYWRAVNSPCSASISSTVT